MPPPKEFPVARTVRTTRKIDREVEGFRVSKALKSYGEAVRRLIASGLKAEAKADAERP